MIKMDFKNQVNAVGGLSMIVVAGFFAYELTRSREIGPCGSRFNTVTEMALLKQGGEPMSPAELQARLGVGEIGVLEKGSVVSLRDGPTKVALNVAVGGPVEADTGLSFYWSPGVMGRVPTACLSYDVFLPVEFDYSRGGRLPGLFGGNFAGISAASQNSVGIHLLWDERGQIGIEGVVPGAAGTSDVSLIRYGSEFELPRGRWVRIDQEIGLNNPGDEDGILRLWIDGRVKLEDKTVVWRPDATLAMTGAWADIGYLSFGGVERSAHKYANIIISPLRLSWQ